MTNARAQMHFANLRSSLGDKQLADELGHSSMEEFHATVRLVEDSDEEMPSDLKASIGTLASAYNMPHT